jgi:hypothetical protein
LLYYQSHLCPLHQDADELDGVPEQFVVELPPFQIGDRRSMRILVLPVEQREAEKIRPGDFDKPTLLRKEPNLVFVALLIGRQVQRGFWAPEEEAVFLDVFAKDPDFFEVMGMTALKTRNCFSAAS